MSEPKNFLERWARRKREVAAEEAKAPPPPQSEPPSEPPSETAAAIPEPKPPQAEPPFDPKTLPPLESIAADTDLTPFLAPGVPPDVARAALRRAWSVDPKIRDFVGLSENAWDFNQPGAMGGFGSLEMTDDLRRMVARIVGGPAADVPVETPDEPVKSPEKPSDIGSPPEIAPPATLDGKGGSGEGSPPAGQDVAAVRKEFAATPDAFIATQHEPRAPETDPKTTWRGHGGALPK